MVSEGKSSMMSITRTEMLEDIINVKAIFKENRVEKEIDHGLLDTFIMDVISTCIGRHLKLSIAKQGFKPISTLVKGDINTDISEEFALTFDNNKVPTERITDYEHHKEYWKEELTLIAKAMEQLQPTSLGYINFKQEEHIIEVAYLIRNYLSNKGHSRYATKLRRFLEKQGITL